MSTEEASNGVGCASAVPGISARSWLSELVKPFRIGRHVALQADILGVGADIDATPDSVAPVSVILTWR